ncbi:MAG TPA: aminotransferase class I/II-fold pyridoxal phosphate-dependent enzyme [Acidobacteriaceae bacterium]
MSVAGVVLPSHGGQLRAIARQFGLPQEKLIDFSASISPYPPPEDLLDRLRNFLSDAQFLSQYPDLENDDLKDAISTYAAVPKQSIAVANGMMPLFDAALRSLRLKRCLVIEPAFSGYQRTLRAAGVEAIGWSLAAKDEFSISVPPLLESIAREQCDSVLLANPHSPSGVLTQRDTLQDLCRQAAQSAVTVLLDEAFIDFEPEASLCPMIEQFDNLVVFRSLTKFFAIPALRVGYAVTSAANAESISKFTPEWPISSFAALAAVELMGCIDHQRRVRAQNIAERKALLKFVRQLALTIFPGRANYLLLRMRDEPTGIAAWQSLIVNHGVVLRCCQNFAGLDASYLRFAIRSREENTILCRAFADVLVQPL